MKESLTIYPKPAILTANRFWSKVNKTGNCWEWIAAIGSGGYGVIRCGNNIYAHRASLMFYGVDIPDGMVVDHLCKNRKCVRPEHLEVVTPDENGRRGDSPYAINARRTHCANGHEFTKENTYYRHDNGGRCCKQCGLDRKKTYKPRKSRTETITCLECNKVCDVLVTDKKGRKYCSQKCGNKYRLRAWKLKHHQKSVKA